MMIKKTDSLQKAEHRSMICRVTAFLVILAMIFTMFPIPAQAANVKITPTSINMCIGDKITIKAKGSYKKLTWESSDSDVASVSKKGVVRAKKAGTTSVYATFTLKNKKTITRVCEITVVLTGKIIAVTDVTDAVVSEVVGYLESETPFSIQVKGKRQTLVDTFAILQEKVAKLNEYGVLFLSQDIFTYKNSWLIYISKDDCELYNLSLSFVRKLIMQEIQSADEYMQGEYDVRNNRYITREEQLQLIHSCPTWESYVAAIDTSTEEYEKWAPDVVSRRRYNHRLDWFLFNFKFCDMSQVVQAAIIDRSEFFACNGYGYKESFHNERLLMVYDSENRNSNMRAMESNTASGVCSDFAYCEQILFDALGIPVMYEHNYNHKWILIYPENSDGKQLCYKFDYSMYGEEGHKYYSDMQPAIPSGSSSAEKIHGTIDDIY